MVKGDYEYDNLICLAQKHNFKKIMVMRDSWGYGNWCIVNRVMVKPDGKYGFACGHIHYANGEKENGRIPGAGTYSWRVVKVFGEEMEVEYLEK